MECTEKYSRDTQNDDLTCTFLLRFHKTITQKRVRIRTKNLSLSVHSNESGSFSTPYTWTISYQTTKVYFDNTYLYTLYPSKLKSCTQSTLIHALKLRCWGHCNKGLCRRSRPSAADCLRHQWLVKRSPKPQPQPRPLPSPKHELDVAKDNLRLFVERWSEHPNSPYVFDNQAHEITCLMDGNCERSSIGGCSPSPRSSLASSPDGVFSDDDEPPPLRDSNFLTPRSHPVERRASDSSCFLHKRQDVLVRKNLAEEIKKLSDHLFMLSTINTDLANNNNVKELDKNANVTETKTVSKEENKLPNGFKKENNIVITKAFTNGDATTKERRIFTSKSSHKISSTFLSDREPERPMTSNMPWAKSTRAKKLTSLSRDVPDQPLERRNTFFEEFDKRRDKIDKLVSGSENGRQVPYRRDENNAHRTKDLLLHLLEKWGETETEGERTAGGTSNGGRHQSISLEWTPSSQLAQNSMSSVNAFYQRQSSDEKTQRQKIKITTNVQK